MPTPLTWAWSPVLDEISSILYADAPARERPSGTVFTMSSPRARNATAVPGIANQSDVDLAFGFGRCVTLRRSERTPGLLCAIADELHARGLYQPLLDAMGPAMREAVQFQVSEDFQRASRPSAYKRRTGTGQ